MPVRQLLQFSDLTYLGAFNVPWRWSSPGISSNDNSASLGGLAVRYVSGQVHLLSHAGCSIFADGWTEYLYEMSVPALLTSPPYNTASVVTGWGDHYQGRELTFSGSDWWAQTFSTGCGVTNGSNLITYSSTLSPYFVGQYVAITDGTTTLRGVIASINSGVSITLQSGQNWTGTTSASSATIAAYGYPFSQATQAYGLCWDSSGNRLYCTYAPWYGEAPDDPSFFFVTLDDPAGSTMHAYGPWRCHDASGNNVAKQTGQGVVLIPSWYASSYLGGQYLGVGFGSPLSGGVGSGLASYGPSLWAFAPPAATIYQINLAIAPSATDPLVPNDGHEILSPSAGTLTKLLSYGATGTSVGRRDTDYENRFPTVGLSSSYPACGNIVSSTNAGTNGTLSGLGTVNINLPMNTAANHLAGWRFEAVSPGGVRQEKTILTNTANSSGGVYGVWQSGTLTLDSAWSTLPDSTYSFNIYKGGGTGTVASYTGGGTGTFTTSGFDTRMWGGNYTQAAAISGYYNGATCHIVAGTGAGQSQTVTTYTYSGGVGTFNFASNWSTALDSTSVFAIDGPRYYGSVSSSTSSTLTLDASAPPAITNDLAGTTQGFIKDLATGEEHTVVSYNPSTHTLTIGPGVDASNNPLGSAWNTTPGTGDKYLFRLIGAGSTNFPQPGRGYMTEQDFPIVAVWVDTGTKHGLLYFETRAVGQVYYQSSAPQCDYYKHTVRCFDPLSLLSGQPNWQGSQPDSTSPTGWEADLQIPGITYPIARSFQDDTADAYGYFQGFPPSINLSANSSGLMIMGAAYDQIAKQIYVLVIGSVNQGVEFTPRPCLASRLTYCVGGSPIEAHRGTRSIEDIHVLHLSSINKSRNMLYTETQQ
jgi:hypothetical protein